MLSNDELTNGMTFVLVISDDEGAPQYRMCDLRGNEAREWFGVYQRSDWDALRRTAAATFGPPVPVADAQRTYTSRRCLVIRAMAVSAAELLA